ncbi:MAG: cupredoxin domain-containing protein [Firmicutes bacterium]|nr:cupredoxin domain-containing protein [Bacillota bacterium]
MLRTIPVALLVAAAGCTRPISSTPAPVSPPSPRAQAPTVEVVATDFAFSPRAIRTTAGTVRFQIVNRGAVAHDFAIPSLAGHGDHERHLVKPGSTQVVDLDLTPGTYEAVCTVPGHKEAGMVVTIEVSL